MILAIAFAILAVLVLLSVVRNGRREYRRERREVLRRLICMRVGCGHTFLDHEPECKHCLCQHTSYRWVDEDLPT